MLGIGTEDVNNYTGFPKQLLGVVESLKQRNFYLVDRYIGGDQPKQFIRIYEPGLVRRNSRSKWTPYIAKFGKKWYPGESITEHLITRIGEELGFKMANSKLVLAGGLD